MIQLHGPSAVLHGLLEEVTGNTPVDRAIEKLNQASDLLIHGYPSPKISYDEPSQSTNYWGKLKSRINEFLTRNDTFRYTDTSAIENAPKLTEQFGRSGFLHLKKTPELFITTSSLDPINHVTTQCTATLSFKREDQRSKVISNIREQMELATTASCYAPLHEIVSNERLGELCNTASYHPRVYRNYSIS